MRSYIVYYEKKDGDDPGHFIIEADSAKEAAGEALGMLNNLYRITMVAQIIKNWR